MFQRVVCTPLMFTGVVFFFFGGGRGGWVALARDEKAMMNAFLKKEKGERFLQFLPRGQS